MARGVIALGDWLWPGPPGNAVAIVRPVSSGKINERESKGQDFARTTWEGQKPATIKVELRWLDQEDDPTGADAYATKFLYNVSPHGPNAGKPWEWVADDQELHAAYNAIVETLEGPNRAPGTEEATATLTLKSWVKPKQAALVTKTPDAAQPWGTKPGVSTFTRRTLPGFSKTPVTVKP